MTPTPNKDDVLRLAEVARDLSDRVADMDRGVAQRDAELAHQARVTRRLVAGSWAVLVVLALTLGLGVAALLGVQGTADRLDISTTVSRQRALCPLYQVLIGADTPKARARAADPAAYDRAYVVIRQGYKALGCDQFKGSAPKLG